MADKGCSSLGNLAKHAMNKGQYQQNQVTGPSRFQPELTGEQLDFIQSLDISQNNFNPALQSVDLQICKELNSSQVFNHSHIPPDQIQDNDWTLDFQRHHQEEITQNQIHSANYHQFYRPQFMSQPFVSQPFLQQQFQKHIPEDNWEVAFKKQQESLTSDEWIKEFNKQGDEKITTTNHPDALAQTAGKILEIVEHEENPKFKNSKFMNMMQQFRDNELHIEGDKVVETVADLNTAGIVVDQLKANSDSVEIQNTHINSNQGTRTHALHGPTLEHPTVNEFDTGYMQSFTQNSQNDSASSFNKISQDDELLKEFMQNENVDIEFMDSFPNDPLPSSYKMAEEFSKSNMAWQEDISVGKIVGSPDGWDEEFAAQQDLSGFTTPIPPSVFQNQPTQMFSSDVSHDFDKRELFMDSGFRNLNLNDRDGFEMTADEVKEAQNVMNEAIVHANADQQELYQENELIWEKLRHEYSIAKDYKEELPIVQDYNYIKANPFSNISKEYLTSTAVTENLTETVLKLEALVQQDPTNGNAWFELGKKQQENENDQNAIEALQKSIALLPNNLDAYLALAVSQTNENDTSSTYQSITNWINHNPKYANSSQPTLSSIQTHERLVNTLMQFAINNPVDLDPDIQICLGILFNISSEYKKAIDCFEAALQVSPTDYNLWNKLGATLANSGESEKAIEAYFTALELNPRYIRTRYNLAIACMQLGQIKEAAGYLLGAISIQEDNIKEVILKATPELVPEMRRLETGQGEVLWNALKLFMKTYLFRDDLAEACDRMDLDAFRVEFDF